MGRIIQNLRAFSKQQAEPTVRVDLIFVLEHSVEMIEARAAEMREEMSIDMPDKPVWVQGGDVRLGQVFGNLMHNALDAMSKSLERRLSVSVRLTDAISVEIRDTGAGVSELEKVFEPFFLTRRSVLLWVWGSDCRFPMA